MDPRTRLPLSTRLLGLVAAGLFGWVVIIATAETLGSIIATLIGR